MITNENFTQEFQAFHKANPSLYRMIRRGGRPADSNSIDLTWRQENVWFKYLADKGMVHRAATWRGMISRGAPVMVPCESPDVFDMSYMQSAEIKASDSDNPVMRARLAAVLRELARDLQGKSKAFFPEEVTKAKLWKE